MENMEKDTVKNHMELQVANVTGQPAEMINKKYTVSHFQGQEKQRKREIGVVTL